MGQILFRPILISCRGDILLRALRRAAIDTYTSFRGRALTTVTNSALLTFFSAGVTFLGTRIHQPNPHTVSQHSSDEPHKAWAQIWTASEAEVERCLELKEDMARKGL